MRPQLVDKHSALRRIENLEMWRFEDFTLVVDNTKSG